MKKLWKNNRVLFMLILILFICFIAIVVVALTFFYSKDVDSYGSRLADIEKYPITSKVKSSYKETVLENEGVSKVSLNIKGRILYVHLEFDENVSLEDAKAIANNSIELFGEDNLSYYDIEFVLKSDNFTILGAKNAIIDHVSWNNNREVEEEEVTNEK
ncbi:MAG: hypothetical protein E7167_00705 [Firmicutes bacterium]|nr:hypothetical protein [Bacillota bacterium]